MLALVLLAVVALVWGAPIHILHTTDVHSWVDAHPHNTTLNADLGSLVSFTERFRTMALGDGDDVLMFDTGDFIQGTGFSDASEIVGQYAYDVTTNVAYDAVTAGNHDISVEDSVQYMVDNFIPHWGDTFVTTNIYKDGDYLGVPYTVITSAQGLKVLVLGFIYHFSNTSPGIEIHDLDAIETEPMFLEAMDQEYDLLVLLCHIGAQSGAGDIQTIRDMIDRHTPDRTPTVVLTGHEHQYYWADWVEEDNSFLLESRCFSEAVGIATFELDAGEITGLTHEWVLYNEADFSRRVGVTQDQFMTTHGLAVRDQVSTHVDELELEEVLGVSPQRYSAMNPSLIDEGSMYALWMQLIVPCSLVGKAAPNNGYAYITTTSLLENDVYPGDFTINDAYVTSPFVDEYFVVAKDVLGADLITIYNHLQHYDTLDSPLIGSPTGWMHYVLYPTIPMIDAAETYSLLASDYDGSKVEKAITQLGMDAQYEVEHFSYDSPHSCLMEFISNNWSDTGFFKWTC